MRREVLDVSTTPDGGSLELARMGAEYTIRVDGVLLMSSAMFGSEQAMAELAVEVMSPVRRPRVLVGGLGMGYTLRAALDVFGPSASVTVAELLKAVVAYNRGPLAELADGPLDDPRVRVFVGDVAVPLAEGQWDAILLDVDNGPGAMTAAANASLYNRRGVAMLAGALTRGGVVVVWSASPCAPFVASLRRAGLKAEERRVYARGKTRKGPRHTLVVAHR